MSVTYVLHLATLAVLLPMAQNYDTKYTKANVPLWKQRACEKAQKQKANSHYICDDKGDVKCLPGWQGDLCQVPMCRKGCDPMNGYCQRPGECRCRIGYTGEFCEKCIPLPGCQHGDCTKPFECICRPGWDGLFCTEAACRQGCHSTRGYCEGPGECRCRIGWAGRNCSDCAVLPGCQQGTCKKPLECNCLPGFTGLLCQLPICSADCHKQHGYCKKPGECRCKVGWTGAKCDQCFPYPGCVHGDCGKPWECNCKAGWGGMLCDEALSYCKENRNTCENGGRCISLTKEDGNYHCHCKQGYLGKNCEIVDEFMLTSTSPPRITPPTPLDWELEEEEQDADITENLISRTNGTAASTNKNQTLASAVVQNPGKRENNTDTLGNSESSLSTEHGLVLEHTTKGSVEKTSGTPTTITNTTLLPLTENELANMADISGSDIIGTATTIHMDEAESHTPKSPHNMFNGSSISLNMNTTKTKDKDQSITNNNSNTKTTKPPTFTTSPLSRLEEEKHQPTFLEMPKDKKTEAAKETETNDEDDEECDDDNDDECEYEDEEDDEEEEEDDDDDDK